MARENGAREQHGLYQSSCLYGDTTRLSMTRPIDSAGPVPACMGSLCCRLSAQDFGACELVSGLAQDHESSRPADAVRVPCWSQQPQLAPGSLIHAAAPFSPSPEHGSGHCPR